MSELDNNLDSQTPETTEENVIQEAVVEDVVEEVKPIPAMLAPEEPVIPADKVEAIQEFVQGIAPLSTGAIGVAKQPKPKKEKEVAKPKKDKEKVAIRSTRNVSWMGVGQVKIGINYVTPEEAKEWSKRDHITVLNPQDVAKEYGL